MMAGMSRASNDPRHLCLGIDFGSDSVRALLVDARDGCPIACGSAAYQAWAAGRYCDPARQIFRQHPRDLLQAMGRAVKAALDSAGPGVAERIAGIGIDTTGSSPLPLDARCRPLALDPVFAEDPDAMMVLWKDHSSAAEATRFNDLCHGGRFPDYTRFVGGIYSSEWWWAKIAHVQAGNRKVAAAAHTWAEHCDWLPAELCGITDPAAIVRSRCAAGHKACWHPSWEGLPDAAFLRALHPSLAPLRARLYTTTATADQPVGRLTAAWGKRLGLPEGIVVAAGAFDAHLGAVGAGARPFELAKVIGTSTCDMLCAPAAAIGKRTVRGICGQVDGSILPGLIGLEAGQSAFGDIFAWYRRLLGWGGGSADDLLSRLEVAAKDLAPGAGGLVSLDWFNGRRTPDADARARGCISGLHLGHDAPAVYRSLIEGAACGARAIVERFVDQGVPVKRILALGGIATRSPLVMRILTDVLNRPIAIVASDQCCALGAAISAAAASGVHQSLAVAQRRMASPVAVTLRPDRRQARLYDSVYASYLKLGGAHAPA
jgi:L-ribulokinase